MFTIGGLRCANPPYVLSLPLWERAGEKAFKTGEGKQAPRMTFHDKRVHVLAAQDFFALQQGGVC
jgi:hypothetical protein